MKVSHVLDEMLVTQSQQGDKKAFQILVKRWHLKVLRYAAKVTGDSNAANDIAQDCWQSIIRGLPKLKDPARFGTWVYRITNNKSVDWIRKNQRNRNFIQEYKKDSESYSEPDDGQDKLDIITEALKELPQDQKVVLTLFYLEGQSLKQISEILQRPTGTVKSRLFHAREHLKKLIKEVKNEEI